MKNLNEEGKALYKFTFNERYQHRMDFADYLHDYILNCQIDRFSNTRIFDTYDAFEEKLMNGGVKDGDVITINDKKKPVVEMTVMDDKVNIKFKAGRKWVELKIPVEMIKFTDWSLYT